MNKENIKGILEKAIRAPSGDNSQPWQFAITENSIKIFAMPEKDHPYLNVYEGGTYIAVGALIENVLLISESEGYKTQIKYFPEGVNSNFAALIEFVGNIPKTDNLAVVVEKRQTNRKPYEKKLLEGKIIKEFFDEIKIIEPAYTDLLTITTDKEKILKLAETSSMMEEIMLENTQLHKIFFEDIVWTEQEEKVKRKGLYLQTLELPKPVEALFHLIKKPRVIQLMNTIGFAKSVAKGNAKIYSSSGAIGVFSIKSFDKENFLLLGRLIERIWLRATVYNLGFQPITGILFLYFFSNNNQNSFLSKRHREKIEKSYNEIVEIIGKKGIPIFMFRAGYAEKPSAKTSRFNINDSIVEA